MDGRGRWTSCPLELAVDEEEVPALDLEDSPEPPMIPPRSLAFRTSVGRSGLLAVPAERSRLRRLLLVLVPVLVLGPVPASGGARVILFSGGAEESKLAFICADSDSAEEGSTAPV